MRCCIDAAAAVVEAPMPMPTSATEIQPLQSSPASPAPRPSLSISLNEIPSELLGLALGYLPLADVLSCRQTRNRHLGRDAVRRVRHLNVTQTKELDARYATIFSSVKWVNIMCSLSDTAIIDGGHNLSTFLEALVGLKRVFLDRTQVRRALERLTISDGVNAIRVLLLSTRRSGAAEFIDRMAREGSGNNGRRENIMSLTKEARAVLEVFHKYDSATTRMVASEAAMTESLRQEMRDLYTWGHRESVGKIVIRDATLDFLVDTVGFGLDREEFIPIDVDAEPAVPDYETWRSSFRDSQ